LTAMRFTARDPDLDDLEERYHELHRSRGNDLSVGLRLGELLAGAGLAVERYAPNTPVIQVPPGMRSPAWAAHKQIIAAGLATDADELRWADAFARLDAVTERPWLFPASFVAIGRRPGHGS
jgi:hypothetical protein